MRSARPIFLAITIAVLTTACRSQVQHGLDEAAANEIVTALERSGIGAQKTKEEGQEGGFLVTVSQGDGVRALETLRTLGLPRGRRAGFGEVYAEPSLVPTATEERARYLEALSGEIERTLESVEGVVGARVHLVLSETDPLSVDGKPRVPAQAAVLLKARPGTPPLSEADVQKLVAGSVPGLLPTGVAVVVTAAPETAPAGPNSLSSVGPLRVSPGSRPMLLGGIIAGLLILAALSALLLYTAKRLSAIQRQLMGRP